MSGAGTQGSPGTSPHVVELTAAGEPAYERYVSISPPHARLYSSLRFRDFLVDHLECQPRYATCVVDLHFGLPLYGLVPAALRV